MIRRIRLGAGARDAVVAFFDLAGDLGGVRPPQGTVPVDLAVYNHPIGAFGMCPLDAVADRLGVRGGRGPAPQQPTTTSVSAVSWPPEGLAPNPESLEVEPNNAPEEAQQVTLPLDVSGSFYPAADVDTYEFSAKKGEVWWVEVASARLGLPTDPFVLVQKVTKKGDEETLTDVAELYDIASPVKVSSNGYSYDGPPYNVGSPDVLGKFEVKEDGLYRIQVRDLFGGTRNEPENIYRLLVRKAQPDFALATWAVHMTLRNGDRAAFSKPIALRAGAAMAFEVLVIRRDGFDGEIELSMEGLPPGVSAAGLKIPAGKSVGHLIISADAAAKRGHSLATVVGRATIDGKVVTRPCRLASMEWPVKDAKQEIPSPRLFADIPVSVTDAEASPLTLTAAEDKVWKATVGETLTIPLQAEWRGDFSGIVHHQHLGKGDRLAHRGGVGVDQRGIEEGRAERLGQAVHGEDPRLRKHTAQAAHKVGRERAAAIGQAAERRRSLGRPLRLEQLHPERRDRRQRGHAMARAGLHHVARREVIEWDGARPCPPCAEQLVLPVIEGERQHGEHHIIRREAEIMRHADRAEPEIGVAEHHALGRAGRAAGIEQRRQLMRVRPGGTERRLPGRLVGETVDVDGRRAYVTTLRTREQDIRREKASSNVCTNQTLIAVVCAIQLAWLGPEGLRELALRCARATRYTREALCAIDGVEPLAPAPTLREFAVKIPVDAATLVDRLADEGFLAGIPLGAEYGGGLLVAATERRTRSEIDAYAAAFEKAVR